MTSSLILIYLVLLPLTISAQETVISLTDGSLTDVIIVSSLVSFLTGPTIAIFHQMAHSPLGRTIISSLQLEHFKYKVDERSIHAQGEQSICAPNNKLCRLYTKST